MQPLPHNWEVMYLMVQLVQSMYQHQGLIHTKQQMGGHIMLVEYKQYKHKQNGDINLSPFFMYF